MKEGIMRVSPTLVATNKLAKYRITNEKKEGLGRVETFLVDLCNWKTPFVIASFGGIEGLTDKWYAIPYELLDFKTERQEFILSVPQKVIKKAPGVAPTKWGPKRIDLRWLSEACRYYDCIPYWEV